MKSPLALACALVALACVVGVLTFAGPCVHDDGSVSTCHAAQVAVAVAGCVAVAGSAVCAFSGREAVSAAASAVTAAAGAFVAASPGVLFPLCMMQTMRCHAVMRPFAEVMGVVICALAVISLVRELRHRGAAGGSHA